MSTWTPLWPINGNDAHVRISVTDVGRDLARSCPESRALKARPEVWPVSPFVPRRYSRYTAFTLGVIRDAVLAIEGGDIPDDADLHALASAAVAWVIEHGDVKGEVPEAARRWIVHAVASIC